MQTISKMVSMTQKKEEKNKVLISHGRRNNLARRKASNPRQPGSKPAE